MLEENRLSSCRIGSSSWISNLSCNSEESEDPVIVSGDLEWLKGVTPSITEIFEGLEIFRSENVVSSGTRVIPSISSSARA